MIIACAVNHFQQLLRHVSWRRHPWSRSTLNTCQKMNFSWIFQKRFSKYYQIPGFIHIYSHLPKKSSMKNFNFELQYSIRDPFHRTVTPWKVSVFGVLWSVFSGIWTEYGKNRVFLRIQFEFGNVQTRKTANTDTFHEMCNTLELLKKLWMNFYFANSQTTLTFSWRKSLWFVEQINGQVSIW